jgi:hypothetical protein
MVQVNIVFGQRTDREAKEILQFLESHLGYKKFRFQLPRPYSKDTDHYTTGSTPTSSTFYCPSWKHTVVYKNNNTISATFIESASSVPEDLRNVFAMGDRRNDEACFGAEIYNQVTLSSMCVLSSVMEAAFSVPDYLYSNTLNPYFPTIKTEPQRAFFSGVGIHDMQYDFEHSHMAGKVVTRMQYGGIMRNSNCLAQAFNADSSLHTRMVPVGQYPAAEFVLKNILIDRKEPADDISAEKGMLDAVAATKGIRIIMYSDLNFQGDVIFDETGPFIIYNNFWVEQDAYRERLWNSKIKQAMIQLGYLQELEMSISDIWKLRPSYNDGAKLGFLPKAGDYLKSYGIYDVHIHWAKNSWRHVKSFKVEDMN